MQACLDVVALRPGAGRQLVVAIENQLGLKYFAGATEDHLGTHYSGVEDRYQPQGVRTMGRRQLERALRTAGFTQVVFQFPFPDYKLPVAVLFEQGLAREGFRPSEIVRHLYARDYAGRTCTPSTPRRSRRCGGQRPARGPVEFLLVLAAPAGGRGLAVDDAVLAVAYSAGRARAFQTQTHFRSQADGSILCEKTRVHAESATPQGPRRRASPTACCGTPMCAGRPCIRGSSLRSGT